MAEVARRGEGAGRRRSTPEQEAEWKKRLAPIAAEWAQGVPDGAKVLEAFRAEVAAARGKR